MREILFRGKLSGGSGDWISGNLFIPDKKDTPTQICFGTNIVRISFDIIPETVGQYTGLTDKNGKKIFEGDIVKHFDNSDENYDIGEVYYDTEFVGWRRTTQGRFHKNTIISTYKLNPTCIYEVIGNIHDNPELLNEMRA